MSSRQPLRIANTLGLRHRLSAYDVTAGVLVVAVVVAAALEPPTAYLVPLVVAAWTVAYWTLKRETSPRYRRHQ
jgi:Flp pilus assembly protein TadB